MKNNFLKMALEEAGLEVETPEVLSTVDEKEIEKLDEVVDGSIAEATGLVNEVETVQEVQAGLEALVASMEAALADPYYSPREYQLQVNHAQALLAKLGIGSSPTISTESVESAQLSMESFAEKAKKLGKVVAEYIRKFVEWIKTKFKSGFNALQRKTQAVYKMVRSAVFKEVEFEYEIHDFAEGFEFDPNHADKYVTAAINILNGFNKESVKVVNKAIDSLKAGSRDFEEAVFADFKQIVDRLLEGTKLPGNPQFLYDEDKKRFSFHYEAKTEMFKSRTKKLNLVIKEAGVATIFKETEELIDHVANEVMLKAAKVLWAQDSSTSNETIEAVKSLVTATNALTNYCYRLMSFNVEFIRKYLLVQSGKDQEVLPKEEA